MGCWRYSTMNGVRVAARDSIQHVVQRTTGRGESTTIAALPHNNLAAMSAAAIHRFHGLYVYVHGLKE